MPTSIDPEPADDEIECGNCHAHFYIGLTRCPNCGINLYEPEEDAPAAAEKRQPPNRSKIRLRERLDDLFHHLTGKPYPVDKLFGAALEQAELFTDLLGKTAGDRAEAERLVEVEHRRAPRGKRTQWIHSALQRWEKDHPESNKL